MAVKLDAQTLGFVFQARPDILADIHRAAADSPSNINLFNNIASYVYERLATTGEEGPASKRRRVDIAPTQTNGFSASQQNGQASGADAAADPVLLEIKDISVSVPQRKKYDLCFTKNFLYARAPGSSAPVQGIAYPWRDIEHIFYLPVPDKSQVQYNYILFPRNSYLPTTKQANGAGTAGGDQLEPLVFTVPTTAPKPGGVTGPSATAAESVSDSYSSLFHWALTTTLRSAGNRTCELIASDPRVFHSVARQAYRPNEKAVHVKAFRGSKDGFLFFLPTGILWGFKKPLLFLPLDRILAVSYTSVLQRTFNMVVEFEGRDGPEEIEFGMLDQEDYQGIDETYVKRHGLADRSMAEQRKAKRELAENAKKGDAGGEGAAGAEDPGDGLTELERAHREAEQALQDEEDEDEDDYDPGSEGSSEGSGSSDEEDEDGEGEGEDYDEDEEEELDEEMHVGE